MKPNHEPVILPAQLRAAVREIIPEVLAEMLGVTLLPPVAHNREWFDAEEAARLLDLNRPEKLHKMRRNGLLQEGRHCRTTNDTASAKIPRWQYHVGRCRDVLNQSIAKRPSRSKSIR
ncbi:hypothetical protein Q2T42_20195 [Leptolyngbya boryana CZ1]|uniref:Uncharacterized protein n=1 Tax=Leptolyngbya boryana CZ1 TaxID=3060204 RepID=A0AA97ALN0_LEPBY|nr:hypothetical protein [Leptolyngbya boryana]WNZ44153.1 hypothetical protein Q2T42_20195 [Leptolyngbya boryana CZ1]